MVGDVVVLTGVVVIMLGMNWKLALVTFALVPLLVLAAAYFRVRARDSYRVVRTRLARLNAFLQESLQGMSVIQLFAREARSAETFARLNGELRAGQFRSTFYDASLYATVEALGSAAVALLLWYGGGQVVTGALTFGGLVAFLEYTGPLLPAHPGPGREVHGDAGRHGLGRAHLRPPRHPALDTSPTPADTSPVPADGRRGAQLQGEVQPKASRADTRKEAPVATPPAPAVEFRNVWFAYEAEQWVLRDCSFTLAPGERVALVGPTGEGKTTIARLMIRAYDVTRGQVLVDGVDVREWDLRTLRRHVGLVPQEVFLFSGTVEDNLRLAAQRRRGSPSDRARARSRERGALRRGAAARTRRGAARARRQSLAGTASAAGHRPRPHL